VIAALLPAALLGLLSWQVLVGGRHAAPHYHGRTIAGIVCAHQCRYAGVALASPNELDAFVSSTGVKPGLVEVYQTFGDPFPASWAASVSARGILPVIQINPSKVTLPDIAAGRYDHYLAGYAAAVGRFGRPVALSFAHEMNGDWYGWGCGHVRPSVFVAAWRHMVTVMRNGGARRAIWLWTANVEARGDCPLVSRYPGDAYVTWVGMDGYLRRPGTTFARVFSASLFQAARFSHHKPLLIAEAGAEAGPGWASRIWGLYQGAASTPGVIGLVYFDGETAKYGDYRPQDDPSALVAFRRGVASMLAAPVAGGSGLLARPPARSPHRSRADLS